jgi:hypothetical protein
MDQNGPPDAPGSMWLRDFLPQAIPQARCVTYGYNSALLGSNTSVSSVADFSRDLLQRIADDRELEGVCIFPVRHDVCG